MTTRTKYRLSMSKECNKLLHGKRLAQKLKRTVKKVYEASNYDWMRSMVPERK